MLRDLTSGTTATRQVQESTCHTSAAMVTHRAALVVAIEAHAIAIADTAEINVAVAAVAIMIERHTDRVV